MTLVDFLLARIAEDEERASAATPGPWIPVSQGFATPAGDPFITAPYHELDISEENEEHIVRWRPDRVLAECKAKRRIVEADARRWTLREDAPNGLAYGGVPGSPLLRVRLDENSDDLMTWDEFQARYCKRAESSDHLRLLALPYADHPDYDEDWRP